MKKILFTILLIFSCFTIVDAKCTNEKKTLVNGQINQVNAHSEFIEENTRKFIININNITSDIYVSISNNTNSSVLEYHYKQTDNGSITFDAIPFSKIIKYKIAIKAKDSTCVVNDKVLEVTKPIYNYFSEHPYCEGIESYYMCSRLINNEITLAELKEATDNYRDSLSSSIKKQEEENNGGNRFFLIILISFIVIGTIIILYYLYEKIKLNIEIKKRGI